MLILRFLRRCCREVFPLMLWLSAMLFNTLFLPVTVTAGQPTSGDRLVNAARGCNLAEVKTLLDANISANEKSIYDETALNEAILGMGTMPGNTAQCKQVVDLLLEHGANPSECSSIGISPLQLAKNGKYIDLVERLLKVGAKDYAALMPNCVEAANAGRNSDRNIRIFSIYVLKNCGADGVLPLTTLLRDEDPSINILIATKKRYLV